MTDPASQILTIASDLVAQIDPSAQVEVSKDEESYFIQIDSEPSGAFIGYHGESLRALQTIFSIIVGKKLGNEIRVSVNVADYQQQRELQLENMSNKAVDIVRESQMSYTMPSLSGKERRYVHLYLSELEDIKTESVGEGEERRLVVFPKIASES